MQKKLAPDVTVTYYPLMPGVTVTSDNNERTTMVASTPQDDYARTALRLPRDLHKAVHAAAKREDRTFNGQIVAMLRAAVQKPAQPQGVAQ